MKIPKNMKNQQMTFFTNSNEKITIKRRRLANNRGWYIFINGERFFKNIPCGDEAEAAAFVAWMRIHH